MLVEHNPRKFSFLISLSLSLYIYIYIYMYIFIYHVKSEEGEDSLSLLRRTCSQLNVQFLPDGSSLVLLHALGRELGT